MDIFDILTMIGGLCLFLFGMTIMDDALERAAGSSLRSILGKLTSGRFLGFLTGLAVTSVIQSSSATTVMVVGFVNSEMAQCTVETFRNAVSAFNGFSPEIFQLVKKGEEQTDHYEDMLSSYLVKLSSLQISESDSTEAANLLKAIGDHCSNIAGCIVDMHLGSQNTHEALRSARIANEHFSEQYTAFARKYSLK